MKRFLQFNSLFKSTSLYIFSNIVIAAIPLLFLPVLTRYLTPSDYGIVALYQVVLTFLGAIFGFSVNGFCNIKFFELKGKVENHKLYIANSVALLLAMMLLMTALIVILYFSRQFIYGLNTSLLFLLPIAFFSQYVIYIRLGLYQVKNESAFYCLLNIFNAFINIAITLLLVVSLEMGYLGRLLGIVFSLVIIACISLYSLHKSNLITFNIDKNIIKEIIKYGISYSPNIVFVSLIPLLQRTVIAILLGANSVGIFMVSNQIANGFQLVISSFITAYTPVVYKRISMQTNNVLLKNTLIKEVLIFTFYLVLSLLLLSTEILDFILSVVLPANYYEAIPLAKLLVMSVVLKTGVMLLSIYPTYMKFNAKLSLVTLLFGFLEIIIIYMFVADKGLLLVGYVSIFIKITMLLVLLLMVITLIRDFSFYSDDKDNKRCL